MEGSVTNVFGVPVPSTDPVFLNVVRFHIVAGIACVAAGIAAMLADKGRGRHSMLGTIYYWCVTFIVASAAGLSVVRWTENMHLFFLGVLSFTAATIARMVLRSSGHNRLKFHIAGMGASFIFLLTAFYVDNGRNLPLWSALPQWTFWILPAAVGTPLVIHALLRHPLTRR
jgi:uncharacterized membrane protein